MNTRHRLSLDRFNLRVFTQWFSCRIKLQESSLVDCFGKIEGSTQQLSRNHHKANDEQTAMV